MGLAELQADFDELVGQGPEAIVLGDLLASTPERLVRDRVWDGLAAGFEGERPIGSVAGETGVGAEAGRLATAERAVGEVTGAEIADRGELQVDLVEPELEGRDVGVADTVRQPCIMNATTAYRSENRTRTCIRVRKVAHLFYIDYNSRGLDYDSEDTVALRVLYTDELAPLLGKNVCITLGNPSAAEPCCCSCLQAALPQSQSLHRSPVPMDARCCIDIPLKGCRSPAHCLESSYISTGTMLALSKAC